MQKRGIPYLMDVPYLGAAFSRKISNEINEVELLIMVRPELVEAMDPDQVPPCGPGMTSHEPRRLRPVLEGLHRSAGQRRHMDRARSGPWARTGPGSSGASRTPSAAGNAAGLSAGRTSRARGRGQRRPRATPRVADDSPQSHRRRGEAKPPTPTIPPIRRRRTSAQRRKSRISPPGFIGPIGYDVRNKSRALESAQSSRVQG